MSSGRLWQLPGCPPCSFHAIDTSNIMDYVGLYNLLLAVQPALRRGAILQTESIIGLADSREGLLHQELP